MNKITKINNGQGHWLSYKEAIGDEHWLSYKGAIGDELCKNFNRILTFEANKDLRSIKNNN